MRVGARADVVPVEDVLAERRVPARGGGRERRGREALRRGVRVGVERRLAVARIAGPPADRDLLGVHRVAHDEVVRRRVGGQAGEQVHREVERAPPGVDRRRAAAIRRAERGEDERRAGRGGEVGGDLGGVIARVLVVLVERHVHGTSCGVGSISTAPASARTASSTLARDLADRPVGVERDALDATVAVLDERLVGSQVERDDERPRAVRRRQRGGLPAPRGQAQRRVLELRLGRGERHRQLAEDLGVRVQRVAGLAPLLIGERGRMRSGMAKRYTLPARQEASTPQRCAYRRSAGPMRGASSSQPTIATARRTIIRLPTSAVAPPAHRASRQLALATRWPSCAPARRISAVEAFKAAPASAL